MVAALEGAWAAIRARHPEVPAVVVVLGAGSIGTAGVLRLGHFAAMRWAGPDQPAGAVAADEVSEAPRAGTPEPLPEVDSGQSKLPVGGHLPPR